MFYYLLIEYFFHLALQYDIAKESCAAGPAGQPSNVGRITYTKLAQSKLNELKLKSKNRKVRIRTKL